MHGSCRSTGQGEDQWRIYHFLMPFHTLIGGGGSGSVWVPVDDEYTMAWSFQYDPEKPASDDELVIGGLIHGGYLPTTTDWMGRWRLVANETNDFLIDRERQRTKCFTGMPFSNVIEDGAVTTSMGHILDRTREHLGTSDMAIVRVRRRLIECVRAFAATGATPPGVDDSGLYGVRAGAVMLPKGTHDWVGSSETLRNAYVRQREAQVQTAAK